MPFKSEAQRRLFYALKAKGEMDQKTINEWEKDTPANIPERITKTSALEREIDKIVMCMPMDHLLKLAEYDFEKDAAGVVGGLLNTLGRGVRWTGESLANAAIGSRGGLTFKQIFEPLQMSLSPTRTVNRTLFGRKLPLTKEVKRKVTPVRKFDFLGGLRNVGRLRKEVREGPLKGMTVYNKKGKVDFEQLKPGMAGVGQRVMNMPKFMWQEIKGRRATRADWLLNDMARKSGMERDQFVRSMMRNPFKRKEFMNRLSTVQNQSMADFIRQNPAMAAKYYGTKGLWTGLLVGYPIHDVSQSLQGKGEPGQSVAGNVGRSLGLGAGYAAFGPLGLGGAILGAEGLAAAGGKIGNKFGKVTGLGSRVTREHPESLPVEYQQKTQWVPGSAYAGRNLAYPPSQMASYPGTRRYTS